MACVCGRAVAAKGTHALVCSAVWHTVVSRHNMMVHAWRRVFVRAGISSSLQAHVKRLPQRLRTAGLPALPSRPTGSHPRDSKAACATLTISDLPTSPGLSVPSTPYGTQAPALGTPSAIPPLPPSPHHCALGHTISVSHPRCGLGHTTCAVSNPNGPLPCRRCHLCCDHCHCRSSRGPCCHCHSHD